MLLIVLLTAPMIRECCLPVTQASPCHETKHTEDVTCSSNQQALAPSQAVLGAGSFSDWELPLMHDGKSSLLTLAREVQRSIALDPTPRNDIYLETCALLI